MKILVIAPHPDDEVLGMGGTIKKLSPKNNITLLIMTDGASAQYSDKKMIKVRKESCKKSSKILGISEIKFLNFKDMKLDSVPQLEINQEIEKIIKKIQPKIVFTSPKNDLNRDHDVTFNSTLVATRPSSSGVKKVFSYELPGYTYLESLSLKKPTVGSSWCSISEYLKDIFKKEALSLFTS